jgi:type I restriction enzyme, S subunit
VRFANSLNQGVGRPRVRWEQISKYPFPLPPLTEQRRIVAAIEEQLSRLEAATTALSSAAKRSDALRAAILGRLTELSGEDVLTGHVAEVQGGIQKQPRRRPVRNRFPFLRVANVKRSELDLSDVHEVELFGNEVDRFGLRRGDLLVVEGNGSPDQIGRSAMWHGEIPNCVHQNHLIRVRPGPRLDPLFLSLYWNAPATARRLRDVASSTSGLYTLSTAKVKAVPLRVPGLDEQRRVATETFEQLAQLYQLRGEIDAAARSADSLRPAVLATAFRGGLVRQDPADESASVLLTRIIAENNATPKPTRQRRAKASA